MKKKLFILNKYQSVTHVSIFIFQGLFKNIVFRYAAIVTKKLWAILDYFFQRPDFFLPCAKPYALRKNLQKSLKLLFIKSHKNGKLNAFRDFFELQICFIYTMFDSLQIRPTYIWYYVKLKYFILKSYIF